MGHINEGDEVDVWLLGGTEKMSGVVRHMPQATGDCWIIENAAVITYFQQFEQIIKVKREAHDGE